jgi:hypothetical protein
MHQEYSYTVNALPPYTNTFNDHDRGHAKVFLVLYGKGKSSIWSVQLTTLIPSHNQHFPRYNACNRYAVFLLRLSSPSGMGY